LTNNWNKTSNSCLFFLLFPPGPSGSVWGRRSRQVHRYCEFLFTQCVCVCMCVCVCACACVHAQSYPAAFGLLRSKITTPSLGWMPGWVASYWPSRNP